MEKKELIKKIQQFEQDFYSIRDELAKVFNQKQLDKLFADLPDFRNDVSDFEFIARQSLEQLIKEEDENE